jgi:hypothetical protein
MDNRDDEGSGWSCCSDESGFADSDYRKVTKRRRGTSAVHVSLHLQSSTDEENTRLSSQDGHVDTSDPSACEITRSYEDENKCSTSDSEDDM